MISHTQKRMHTQIHSIYLYLFLFSDIEIRDSIITVDKMYHTVCVYPVLARLHADEIVQYYMMYY